MVSAPRSGAPHADNAEIATGAGPSVGRPTLEGRGLACVRDDRTLFSDLSFTLNGGQILQVEGANGSGKTTLLRTLCGLSLPSEGQVCWCGTDIEESRSDYLGEVAYIGHAHGVKAELTPIENLAVAQALGRAAPEMSPEAALDAVGLAGFEDIGCRLLSAGQQRRVGLARLLVTRARLWILDEPFTAIDREGRAAIEALLHAHADAGGMAVVTSHHAVNLPSETVVNIHIGA